MGSRAFGMSLGDDVKVLNEAPGPHRMRAWKPGGGRLVAWGIAGDYAARAVGGGVTGYTVRRRWWR